MNKKDYQLTMVVYMCWAMAGCAQATPTRPDGHHSAPTNCQDLSALDIVFPSGDTGTWYGNPFEMFGANLLFLCNGQPVTGSVTLMPSTEGYPVHGMLKAGRPHGIWSLGDSAQKFLFWRYDFDYEVDTIHWVDRQYYYNGRRNSRWSRISDSLAIDSIWGMPPDDRGLAALGWRDLTVKKAPLWGEQFKFLHFDSLGVLTEYYLKDSIDIEWSEDKTQLDDKVRYCRCQGKGLCVGVLRGRPWKLIEYGGPMGAKVEYWPSDAEGNPYPRGVFKHFESSGKAHSVFVNVDRTHYVH